MPYKRGAPPGNQNRLTHGHFAKVTVSLRRACRRTLVEAQIQLAQARGLARLVETFDGIARMGAAGAAVPPGLLAAFETALARFESGDTLRARGVPKLPRLRLVVSNPCTDEKRKPFKPATACGGGQARGRRRRSR